MRLISLLSSLLLLVFCHADAQEPVPLREQESAPAILQIVEEVDVDSVWVANQVAFALHTAGGRQFVAYYDQNRMMSVASRELGSRQWNKTILPSRLIWDSHNYVALGIDERGYLHVSGNMHVQPLVYFRSERPYDVTSMVELHKMTGNDEQSVTYPKFFNDKAGRLLFSYRAGTCGNGNVLINRYDPENGRWQRYLTTPLFEGIEENDNRAAYHKYVKDSDGNFHFVWMWRWTPLVETCHQLCYATSPDLLHWKNAAGESVNLPFRPDDQALIVDDAPTKGGMHNSRYQILLTKDEKPVIGYVKYDEKGLTQLYLATFNQNTWVSRKISDWNFRWEFFGGGDQMTSGGHFQFAGLSQDGSIVIRWGTEKGESGQYTIDPVTLDQVRPAAPVTPQYPQSIRQRLSDTPGLSVNLLEDSQGPRKDGTRYLLKWESKGQSHGKHAPQVIPAGPVSQLVVLKLQ